MKFLNYVGYVFLFMTLALYSCQSDLEEVVNEENLEFSASRSMGAIDESIVYPKGVIPDWVKNSLSEEELEMVKRFSSKYELRYFQLDSTDFCNIKSNGLSIMEDNKNVPIEDTCELSHFFAKPIVPRIKSFSEIGDNDDSYYMPVGTFQEVWKDYNQDIGTIFVVAMLRCEKNTKIRKLRNASCTAAVEAKTGIHIVEKKWSDGGSVATINGETIDYLVIGVVELSAQIGDSPVAIVYSERVYAGGIWRPFAY